jgi:hypothetical protein
MALRVFLAPSKWILLVGLTGLGLGLGGCSSGDDSSDNYASRFCGLYQPCCAKAGMSGDQAFCKALYGSVQPKSKALADQCLKELEALAQEPDFCNFEFQQPASCDKAFPKQGSGGTKAPGSPCTHDSDCAGDATCETDFNSTQGTCAAFVVVGEGAACIGEKNGSSKSWSGSSQQNEITLCDYAAGMSCQSQVCKLRATAGGTCTSTHGCVDGTYCNNDTCTPQVATGGACTSTYGDECNSAAHCVDTTKTCEPRRADGESCTTDSECTSDLCSDGVCSYNPGLAGLLLGFVCS